MGFNAVCCKGTYPVPSASIRGQEVARKGYTARDLYYRGHNN